MVAKPFSTTRRALIGAAAALPIATLTSPAPLPATDLVRPERSRGLSRAKSREAPPAEPRATQRWHRRFTRYGRLAEEAKEVAERGWFREANDRYERERAMIRARFGRWEDAIETPEGHTLGKAAFARMNEAEEVYYDRHTAPLMRAATLLAETPAPDLPALLAKIRVMQAHELQEEGALPKPALELLAEDVGRFGGRNHNKPGSV